jgi:hypothetical protein
MSLTDCRFGTDADPTRWQHMVLLMMLRPVPALLLLLLLPTAVCHVMPLLTEH